MRTFRLDVFIAPAWILTIVLALLKVAGVIDWSWHYVWLPVTTLAAFFVAALIALLVVKVIVTVRGRLKRLGIKFGLLFNPHALWIGAHYSAYNKRVCINVLPFVTVWVCAEDGKEPKRGVNCE